jgi:hypothetical protein
MYMESGTYFIQAIISSNGVASRFNRNFTYSGLVKQVSGLLFLSTNSPLQLNINQLDFLTPVLLSTITSDYLGSSISSKAKLLNISGQTSGLTGIDLNDYSTLFHYQPVGTGTLSSTAYSFDKEVNYLACSDGNIQGINELGHREFQTGANQFLSIHHVLKGNDFVLADFYKSATMETKIGSFFYPSGDARNELSIDFDVVSLLPIDAQNVRVFGNRNQHGLIYDYSIPDNTLTLKRDQNGIIFRSAISTQNSNLIFTDQGIWLYTDAQGAMNVSAIDAIGGSYEEVNNVVYCFSTHKIYELQGSSLMEMNQLSVADSVLAVHVLYNK